MDKIVNKLRSGLRASLILGIISISWMAIDYLALSSVYSNKITSFSFEWIIILISVIPLILFHVSVFFTLFYAWKYAHKAKAKIEELEKSKSAYNKDGIDDIHVEDDSNPV